MKYQYRFDINMRPARLAVVEQAEAIASEYRRQGYDLTLRQLYYQFVARGLIANKQQEYKRLGDILNDARLAGLFDWDYIVDRTRSHEGGDAAETDPASFLKQAASWYIQQRWTDQPYRVEVWVEKEALAGVVSRAARKYRAGHFSCRGYTSASSLYEASRRIEGLLDEPGVEGVVILHLGDHDPSGIDMTRDIEDRLNEFLIGDFYDHRLVEVRRIALNMDQVQQYNPPPNPAKFTDSRVGPYVSRFGYESWELDALDPATLDALISQHIEGLIEPEPWEAAAAREKTERSLIAAMADKIGDAA